LQVLLGVQDGVVHAFSQGVMDAGQQVPAIMFQHSLQNIVRFSHAYNNHCTFMYLLRDTVEPLLYCYLYQASDSSDVSTRFSFLVIRLFYLNIYGGIKMPVFYIHQCNKRTLWSE
jgi:hypothetical protein